MDSIANDIETVANVATSVLGSATLTMEWMQTPLDELNGVTPMSAIVDGRTREVLTIIEKYKLDKLTSL